LEFFLLKVGPSGPKNLKLKIIYDWVRVILIKIQNPANQDVYDLFKNIEIMRFKNVSFQRNHYRGRVKMT